ncbi:hypothetical protein BGX21_006201, partial [Mortierella sp. AD011]
MSKCTYDFCNKGLLEKAASGKIPEKEARHFRDYHRPEAFLKADPRYTVIFSRLESLSWEFLCA